MPDQANNAPLTVQAYQEKALAADRLPAANLAFPLLGLFGETGSLLSEAKKKHRDAASYTGYEATVVEELGDVLWYLTAVAARAGLPLGEIAHNRDKSFTNWQTNSTIPLPFAVLQPQDMHIQAQPSPAYEDTLLRLAGEVGVLVTDHQAGRLTDNRAAIAGHLIAILRTLIHAANEAGVSLEHAAKKNLFKIFDRWPQERVYPPLMACARTSGPSKCCVQNENIGVKSSPSI